jgi:hypothetical protein
MLTKIAVILEKSVSRRFTQINTDKTLCCTMLTLLPFGAAKNCNFSLTTGSILKFFIHHEGHEVLFLRVLRGEFFKFLTELLWIYLLLMRSYKELMQLVVHPHKSASSAAQQFLRS